MARSTVGATICISDKSWKRRCLKRLLETPRLNSINLHLLDPHDDFLRSFKLISTISFANALPSGLGHFFGSTLVWPFDKEILTFTWVLVRSKCLSENNFSKEITSFGQELMMDKYWYFVLSYIHKLLTMKSNLWKSKGFYKTLYLSVTNLIFELISTHSTSPLDLKLTESITSRKCSLPRCLKMMTSCNLVLWT